MRPEDTQNYRRGMNPAFDRMQDEGMRNSIQTTMPEVEAALTYKMFSISGRKIACSSLRPGMRIRTCANFTWTIVQNSSKLKRIELRHGSVSMVEMYHYLAYNPDFQVMPPSLFFRLKKWLGIT